MQLTLMAILSTPKSDNTLTTSAIGMLVGALAFVILPHIKQLPMWLTVLLIAVAVMRCRTAALKPPRWLLTILTLSIALSVLLSYHGQFGRDAGIALLTAMTAMKLLEARTLRDGVILVFLGYFLAMTHLLYSQSLMMASYLLLALSILLATQVVIQRQHSAFKITAALRLAAVMLVQSIPVTLVLFILFPRIPGPLWSLPEDAYSGLSGLSDTMSPGTISELILSDEIAFRVRFNAPIPPNEQLYWRGPVLWRYDGLSWKGMAEQPDRIVSYQALGSPVDYSVILEPHGQRWLFALDLPGLIPPAAGMTSALQLLHQNRITELLRYDMRSYLEYRSMDMSRWGGLLARRLPSTGNPRTRALAADLHAQFPEQQALVNAVLRLFREQAFYYTLAPPRLGEHSIDTFLFETRRGFCEHYASSFVFLLRAAGVPARIVTGYQGGEFNALGDYFIVRQSDAHAWAEVWFSDRGWVRIDPTAAVAPERIEHGLDATLADTSFLRTRHDNPWLHQLVLGWDVINNTWNEWVLTYGVEQQQELLSSLDFATLGWRETGLTLLIALVVAGLALSVYYTWRLQRPRNPAARVYRNFCAKLARGRLPRFPHEGPLDFAERIATQRPDLAVHVKLIARLYATLRYGKYQREETLQHLRSLVRNLKV